MLTASSSPSPSSPCTGVCRIGAHGLCEGCLRTLEEIAAWPGLDDGRKRHIVDELLPARRR